MKNEDEHREKMWKKISEEEHKNAEEDNEKSIFARMDRESRVRIGHVCYHVCECVNVEDEQTRIKYENFMYHTSECFKYRIVKRQKKRWKNVKEEIGQLRILKIV